MPSERSVADVSPVYMMLNIMTTRTKIVEEVSPSLAADASRVDIEDWSRFDPVPVSAPLRAARDLFARYGYNGTSIREIAKEAGLSVPGLYHYYASKQAILADLILSATTRMLEHTRAADLASDGSAQGRLDNVVGCLLLFHLQCREEAFIGSTEIRSMEDSVRRAHIAQRDVQQHMVQEVLEQGVQEGVFSCSDPSLTARAICSLCVSVSGWYRPNGLRSKDYIVQRYKELIKGMVTCP